MSEQSSPGQVGRLRRKTAEELRVILARKRMSGAELARRTGMKQPYLSRRMTGEVPFDLDDLEVIAKTLGVSVEELLSGANPGSASQTTVARGTGAVRPGGYRAKSRGQLAVSDPATRRPARTVQDKPLIEGADGWMDRAA